MDYVIGLVFLFAAQGQAVQQPGIFSFADMSSCQAAREELKQYVADNYVGVTVEMACIPPEAFQ